MSQRQNRPKVGDGTGLKSFYGQHKNKVTRFVNGRLVVVDPEAPEPVAQEAAAPAADPKPPVVEKKSTGMSNIPPAEQYVNNPNYGKPGFVKYPKPPVAPQSRNDSRESGGIPQKGTNMGGGLAAFDLSAAESWLGGEMRDPFNSTPLPGSPDSMLQYAALNDESNNLGGFGDNVEIKFQSKVTPGAYSEFNAVDALNRSDIPQDIFPVDLKNTEMKTAAQSEGGYQPDLARRAAFLDAKDSMSGMKAVNRHMGTVVNAGNHYIRKGDELVGISRDQYRDYMRGDVGAQALLKDTVKAVTEGGAESPASRTQQPNFPQKDVDMNIEGLKSKIDVGSEDFTRANILPGEMDPAMAPDMNPIETNTDTFFGQ